MRPTVRKLWEGCSRVCRAVPFLQRYEKDTAVVLMYHGVKGGGGDHINVGLERFRQDMRWLDERFEVVDLSAIPEAAGRPGRQVAVTFDDAFRNVYENAVPIIEERGIPATVFVNADKIGDESGVPKMTAKQLADLVDSSLVTIGNHTYSHADLTDISPDDKREEIVRGKEKLEDRFGVDIDKFAYPWGRYDVETVDIVRETHDYAVTTEKRHVAREGDSCLLPRLAPGSSHSSLRWDMSDVGRIALSLLSEI